MTRSEVTDLIGALRSGAMSLDEVAARFRLRSWPRTRSPAPASYAELAAAALIDPGGSVPGSIDDLTAAYDRGEVTREQYRALAHAVADAINAEARRGDRGPGP
ncbi:MAG: hypothetical protein ACLQFR_31145 [Streptosporangiaceae bacterium]